MPPAVRGSVWDLDYTLLSTDTFVEQLSTLVLRRPWLVLCVGLWLLRGRGYCKGRIAALAATLSTATCRAISGVSSTCCGTVHARPSRWSGSPYGVVQTAGSVASVTCCPDTKQPPGSGGVAGGSPRGREPLASSNSRRLSSSTGSLISCRRRGSIGIARRLETSQECLRRITSCEKPSRCSPSGTSASGATPPPAGMRPAGMPLEAAATLRRSPDRTTPPGLPGRNS